MYTDKDIDVDMDIDRPTILPKLMRPTSNNAVLWHQEICPRFVHNHNRKNVVASRSLIFLIAMMVIEIDSSNANGLDRSNTNTNSSGSRSGDSNSDSDVVSIRATL